ncbi:MAG: MotA/TolQ/ExbB proton channel family protein [Planctomycetota bacterium]
MIRHSEGLRASRSICRTGFQWAAVLVVLTLAGLDWQRVIAQESATKEPAGGASRLQPAAVPKGIPSDPVAVLLELGPMLYPMGLCSIVLVWFSIERMVVLRRGRVIPRPFVKRFFEHLEEGKLDPKTALKLCEENGSPIASIFAHGIRKWGKSSVEVEQAIIDGGERQISQLRKHLRVINGVATISPLLGLLGTVVGMIESFNTIATKAGMGKSEALAEGIGLALLSTAAGLIIAIPALVMYMLLAGRVDTLVIEMDGQSQKLVDTISAEGLAEQARSGPRSPTGTKPTIETRKAV